MSVLLTHQCMTDGTIDALIVVKHLRHPHSEPQRTIFMPDICTIQCQSVVKTRTGNSQTPTASQLSNQAVKCSALTDWCRDAVKPWEEGRSQDCFGLANMPAPVRISSNQGTRARVLVCAPSNSALDELLRRILQLGIRDR